MSERISLSLSPSGANPGGSVRLYPEIGPDVIEAHARAARRLRANAMADMARRTWQVLTGRRAKAPVNECDWLKAQAAR